MHVDVFAYLDFRRFLADSYTARKSASRHFTQRVFAARAGVGSPSYLKAVIDGKRNLTPDTARGFARALDLDKVETRFFVGLVAMNQARTTEDRAHYYEELARIPRYRKTRKLERDQYEYYARWYCVVVRELVARADFSEDPEWIAQQLRPAISARQASDAIELLLAIGLLERDAQGRLRQAEPLVSTGPELRSLATRSFHREMLHRAATALDTVVLEDREVGAVTLRLSREQLLALKQRMYEVRQEILQMDGAGNGAEAVFHFAFQLFPVTEFGEEEHGEG